MDEDGRHNPLYLASAACMLLGCYLLSGASARDLAGPVPSALQPLAWLSLYELSLIGVAAFLRRRGALRDSRTLIALEGVFIADAAYLGAETIAGTGAGAFLAAGLLTALAAAKVVLAALLLRVRMQAADLARAVLLLALLFLVPTATTVLQRAGTPLDTPLYAACWIAAVVAGAEVWSARRARFMPVLRVALPASLAGHVWAAYYVHGVSFPAHALTPPLLVAALWISRHAAPGQLPLPRFLLPVFAILFSVPAPAAAGGISPLRLALLASLLVYVLDFWRHGQPAALAVAGLAFLVRLAVAAQDHVLAVMPKTPREWGGVLMATAFLLLGLGAWSSLRRVARRRS